MIKRFSKWIVVIAAAFCLTLSSSSVVSAMESPALLAEESETGNSSDFITGAISSLDEETAKEETDENYIKNFYNSTQTVMTEGLNLFRPHTIVMVLLNVVTMLLELLGSIVSFLVLVLYNFVSSSFMTSVVDGILTAIEKAMFDWSDMNSWAVKIVVISMLLGIAYELIKNFTRLHGKQIVQIVLSGFISMTFIIFIGQNGRKIMSGLETTAENLIVETFVFEGQSGNLEISNKENIFEVMQMQPFMLRHYGTSSYESIATNSDQTVEEAKERVQTLLDEPTEENAKKEMDDYGNTVISQDISTCSQVLFLSFIGLMHRILIGIVIVIMSVIVGVVKILKVILMFLSIYQLLWWMIRRTHKARKWFMDRMMWSVAAILADMIFNVGMYFVMQACAKISTIHPLTMIAFDILMLILFVYLIKNIGTIAARLKEGGGEAMRAMLQGSASPIETFSRIKNSHNNWNRRDEMDDGSDDPYSHFDDDVPESETTEDLSDSSEAMHEEMQQEELADRSEDSLDDLIESDEADPISDSEDEKQADHSRAADEATVASKENKSERGTTEKEEIPDSEDSQGKETEEAEADEIDLKQSDDREEPDDEPAAKQQGDEEDLSDTPDDTLLEEEAIGSEKEESKEINDLTDRTNPVESKISEVKEQDDVDQIEKAEHTGDEKEAASEEEKTAKSEEKINEMVS